MAKKKKAATKKAPKAKKATKPAPKPKRLTGPKRPSVAGPRSVPLPGMGKVRNQKLDNLCESIAETRTQQNALRTNEKGYEQAALAVMQRSDVQSYNHAGVTLLREPGAEKLRVKMARDGAASNDAGEGGGEEAGADEPIFGEDTEPAGDEAGGGDDAGDDSGDGDEQD